jgi:hypothetical protein
MRCDANLEMRCEPGDAMRGLEMRCEPRDAMRACTCDANLEM